MGKKFLKFTSIFICLFAIVFSVNSMNINAADDCPASICGLNPENPGGSLTGQAGNKYLSQFVRVYLADENTRQIYGKVANLSTHGSSFSAINGGTGTRMANYFNEFSRNFSYSTISTTKYDGTGLPLPIYKGGGVTDSFVYNMSNGGTNSTALDNFFKKYLDFNYADFVAERGSGEGVYLVFEPVAVFTFRDRLYALTTAEVALQWPNENTDNPNRAPFMVNLTHNNLPHSLRPDKTEFSGQLVVSGPSSGYLKSSDMNGGKAYGIGVYWANDLFGKTDNLCNESHPLWNPTTKKCIPPELPCDPEVETCDDSRECVAQNNPLGYCATNGMARDDYKADLNGNFDCIYNLDNLKDNDLSRQTQGGGFCDVYCTERIDTTLPEITTNYEVAGWTFEWEPVEVEGKRTCRTKQMNLDRDKKTDWTNNTENISNKNYIASDGASWLTEYEQANYKVKLAYDKWQQAELNYPICAAKSCSNPGDPTCNRTSSTSGGCTGKEKPGESCPPKVTTYSCSPKTTSTSQNYPRGSALGFAPEVSPISEHASTSYSCNGTYCGSIEVSGSQAAATCTTNYRDSCKSSYNTEARKAEYQSAKAARDKLVSKLDKCNSWVDSMTYDFKPKLQVEFWYKKTVALALEDVESDESDSDKYFANFADVAGNKSTTSPQLQDINKHKYNVNSRDIAGYYDCGDGVTKSACTRVTSKSIKWNEIVQREKKISKTYELPKYTFQFIIKANGEFFDPDGTGKVPNDFNPADYEGKLIDIGRSGIPTSHNMSNGGYEIRLTAKDLAHTKSAEPNRFDRFFSVIPGKPYECYYSVTCKDLTCPPPQQECDEKHPDWNPDTNTCDVCDADHPKWNPDTKTCDGGGNGVCKPGHPDWNPVTNTCDDDYNPCEGGICLTAECERGICLTQSGTGLVERVISLDNPFPGDGTERRPGANFLYQQRRYAINSANYDKTIVKNVITNNRGVEGSKIYTEKKPMYKFKITPSDIEKIREYNKVNEYDDFKLSCSNFTAQNGAVLQAVMCRSSFLEQPFMKEILDRADDGSREMNCGMDPNFYKCDEYDGINRIIGGAR